MTLPRMTLPRAASIAGARRPARGRRRRGWRSTAMLAAGLAALLPGIVSAAEEEVTGIAALGFSLPGLVSNLVGFLILMLLLRVFLWDRILRVLDERKQRIEDGLSQAQQAADRAAASEDEARSIMEQARAEGREAVQRAQEAAERLRGELEERARQESEQIVSRARQELQAERDRAVQQLHEEFADLTLSAAERVIGQSLDRSAHQRLIDEVLLGSELSNGQGAGGAGGDGPGAAGDQRPQGS